MCNTALTAALRREEFLSAFEEQVAVIRRQEEIQAELEACGSDMDRMAGILDELDALSKQVRSVLRVWLSFVWSEHISVR